jgi:hypothetical protein
VQLLSDRTGAFARRPKSTAYKPLPSLQEYVLVDIDAAS